MDFLQKLNTEKDYDTMMQRLTDKEGLKNVKGMFPTYNTRVLLSAFLIRNFREYFIIKNDDEVFLKSRLICDHILSLNYAGLSQLYPTFFFTFKKWRDDDICGMKHEINDAHTRLGDMKVEEKDEADEQWNKGIKINQKLMKNTMNLLDIYGSSPPQ